MAKCWFCRQETEDKFVIAFKEKKGLPKQVPVCNNPSCIKQANECFKTRGGLEIHPCEGCPHLDLSQPCCKVKVA